jgi:hypothetical protein
MRKSAHSRAIESLVIAAAKQRRSAGPSQMLWCPGRIAESECAGREAVDALVGLEPGREPARAYANLSDLVAWDDAETAVAWATRAYDLTERLGEVESMLSARVTIDVVAYMSGDLESAARLERRLALVDQAGLENEAGHIWVNLAMVAARQRAYGDVDRYVNALGRRRCPESFRRTLRPGWHADPCRAAFVEAAAGARWRAVESAASARRRPRVGEL